jgi:hypothetical protein
MRGPQRRPARTAVISRATRSGYCGSGRPAHRPRRRSPSVLVRSCTTAAARPIASNALRAPVRARPRTASARTAAAALWCAPACAVRDSSCALLVTISRTSEDRGQRGRNRHHHHSPAKAHGRSERLINPHKSASGALARRSGSRPPPRSRPPAVAKTRPPLTVRGQEHKRTHVLIPAPQPPSAPPYPSRGSGQRPQVASPRLPVPTPPIAALPRSRA